MHQEVQSSPSRDDKHKAFSYFYSGWNAFMEGRPKYPQGIWGIEAVRWYVRGWTKAERAAENFRHGKG